jgi:hypothetical protein
MVSIPCIRREGRGAEPLQFVGAGRVTAQAWRDGLCSGADRPFTPGEQLLPPATTTEPACRGYR